MNTRKYLAELLGTFLFMTIGYLSVAAVAADAVPTPGLLVVPFSFGFGLLAAIFAFGHVSGGHFNPAVTVAAVVDGRTSPMDAVGYIISQIIGAIGAAALVLVALNQEAVASGITKPGPGVTDVGALIIETALTAGFVAVILAATRHATSLAALAIPLTLVAIHFASATLSGASVNPARSIGSALVGGDVSSLWIYLVAPTIGGVIGAIIFRVAAAEDPAPVEVPATV
ncbi:MAG TPA: aquaporin [Candidatus Saccharimonadales bacterium]|nr:aquaporin [Candidatus Saccharimonadales bacterium]